MAIQVINLGQISAFYSGTTAPTNTSVLWYDTTPGINKQKYYDKVLGQWILLTNGSGGGSVIVEDDLTSTSTINALSANQGRVLNNLINSINGTLSGQISTTNGNVSTLNTEYNNLNSRVTSLENGHGGAGITGTYGSASQTLVISASSGNVTAATPTTISIFSSQVSDFTNAVNTILNGKLNVPNGLLQLNSQGLISSQFLPPGTGVKKYAAVNQTAMINLSQAQIGDLCLRSDLNNDVYELVGQYQNISDWRVVSSSYVKSVNGITGPVVTLNTDQILQGTSNKYYTTANVATDLASLLVAGPNISINYNQANSNYTISAKNDLPNSLVFDSNFNVLTLGISNGTTLSTPISLSLANGSITYPKFATSNNPSINYVLGYTSAGLTWVNTGTSAQLTGDVIGSGIGVIPTQISAGVVTYSKIQDISANKRLLGRYSAGPGSTQEITVGQGLTLDASGNLTSSAAGTVTVVNLTSSSLLVNGSGYTTAGNIDIELNTVGVGGNYNIVNVDAYGRVTSGSQINYLQTVNPTNLNATNIGSSGQILSFVTGSQFTWISLLDHALTGFSASTGGQVTSTDSIITGFGKLQYQLANIQPPSFDSTLSVNPISTRTATVGGLVVGGTNSSSATINFHTIYDSSTNMTVGLNYINLTSAGTFSISNPTTSVTTLNLNNFGDLGVAGTIVSPSDITGHTLNISQVGTVLSIVPNNRDIQFNLIDSSGTYTFSNNNGTNTLLTIDASGNSVFSGNVTSKYGILLPENSAPTGTNGLFYYDNALNLFQFYQNGTYVGLGSGATSGITSLTGDISAIGTGAVTATLATVNSNAGTYNNVTVNAKGLVTAAFNVSYLTGNQTITHTGDVTGSGTTSIPLTLATVNSNVGTFNNLTVNAKGLVIAGSNVSYITGNQNITFTGGATGSGTTSVALTLSNSSVTGQLLTGLTISGSTILATDSILTALGKTQNMLNGLIGGMQYQGTWNASINSPNLQSGVGVKGALYKVSVAGTTTLDGVSTWNIGDQVVFDGLTWDKIDGVASEVLSFNTRIGAITLTSSDVTNALTYTPYNSTNPNGYISANQNITHTGDVTGSGTTSIPLTLATVNTNIGTYNNVTVNSKGLITAASNVAYLTSYNGILNQSTQQGSAFFNIAGDGVASSITVAANNTQISPTTPGSYYVTSVGTVGNEGLNLTSAAGYPGYKATFGNTVASGHVGYGIGVTIPNNTTFTNAGISLYVTLAGSTADVAGEDIVQVGGQIFGNSPIVNRNLFNIQNAGVNKFTVSPSQVTSVLPIVFSPITAPTGVNGLIYYDLSSNLFKFYQNGAYVGLSSGSISLSSALTGLSTATGGAITASSTVIQAFGQLQNQISNIPAPTLASVTLAGATTATAIVSTSDFTGVNITGSNITANNGLNANGFARFNSTLFAQAQVVIGGSNGINLGAKHYIVNDNETGTASTKYQILSVGHTNNFAFFTESYNGISLGRNINITSGGASFTANEAGYSFLDKFNKVTGLFTISSGSSVATGAPTTLSQIYSRDTSGNIIISGYLKVGSYTTALAPAGSNGQIYYDTTLNGFQIYQNSGWIGIGTSTLAQVTANGAITSTPIGLNGASSTTNFPISIKNAAETTAINYTTYPTNYAIKIIEAATNNNSGIGFYRADGTTLIGGIFTNSNTQLQIGATNNGALNLNVGQVYFKGGTLIGGDGSISANGASSSGGFYGTYLYLIPNTLATATANRAATNGMSYYNSSTNLFQFYQNGAWTGLGGTLQSVTTGGATTTIPLGFNGVATTGVPLTITNPADTGSYTTLTNPGLSFISAAAANNAGIIFYKSDAVTQAASVFSNGTSNLSLKAANAIVILSAGLFFGANGYQVFDSVGNLTAQSGQGYMKGSALSILPLSGPNQITGGNINLAITNGMTYYNSTFNAYQFYQGGNWVSFNSYGITNTGTSNYTIQYSDNIVNCNNGSTAITITFPSPFTYKNQTYTVVRDSGGASTGTVTLQTPSGQFLVPATGLLGTGSTIALGATGAAGSRLTYVADGTNWILVSSF